MLGVPDERVHRPESAALHGARVLTDAFRLACNGRRAGHNDAREHYDDERILSHGADKLLTLTARVKSSGHGAD
jgi:hypothetical protein